MMWCIGKAINMPDLLIVAYICQAANYVMHIYIYILWINEGGMDIRATTFDYRWRIG